MDYELQYLFCFGNEGASGAATVERKKIERGFQVVVKWQPHNARDYAPSPQPPTITYEARLDFDGDVNYRVKYNATTWASFNQNNADLVAEFRQALYELSDAQGVAELGVRVETTRRNNVAASNFFRGAIPRRDEGGDVDAS